MRYQLRMDWATLNFSEGCMNVKMASELLAGDVDSLCWTKKGLSDHAPVYSPLGLRYTDNNGYSVRPHKLEVSGVGCEHFMMTLPELRSSAENHLSRLDFAFDVIMSRTSWKQFLTQCFAASMISDRERKRYKLQGDGEAMTVYIGSRKSAKFFRIYNKTMEDSHYSYQDADGHYVNLRDDECVIRYEVELHRYKSTGKCAYEYDPSPAFDWYFSDREDHKQLLCDSIRDLWLSFGNEILLPADFEHAEFVRRSEIEQNKKSVQTSADRLEVVKAALHDYPHSFDRTMQYVVERFGQYIPYILQDSQLRQLAFDRCEKLFGFVPDFYIEIGQGSGLSELEDVPEIPWAWMEAGADDQGIINEEFEKRCNQWSY